MTGRIPADITSKTFDLIVIGAGINGAGIARDAAMRGLSVLLLDKNDLAAGTSAWSTRLIHGGLRYLEYGEVGLVRESLRERERLFRLAPHLVRPLSLLIPIYEGGRRGPLTIRAGMILYDLLSFDKTLGRHQMLSRADTLTRAPGLNAEGLLGAGLYYDAQVEYAERLVLENALSARAHGALVLTYARVEKLVVEGNRVRGVEFTDALAGGRVFTARGRAVVNVAGPWVDEMLARFGAGSQPLIGATKGSHLIVRPFPGAPVDALYVEAGTDGRPFFIIPWNNLYLIGTTDLRYEGQLDFVAADDSEMDYLLRETNRALPRAQLTRASILYTYSGLRPLAYSGEGCAERSITRRHFIHDHAPALEGLLSIVGGKLTTYRHLAEQAVNTVVKKLNRPALRCTTAREPLPGAVAEKAEDFQAFGERFIKESALATETSERLLRIYGTRSSLLARLVAARPELAEIICSETGAIGAEVLMSFENELACTLTDCLLRRTMVGLNGAAGIGVDERAARLARKYLGWSEERAAGEINAYRQYLARFHPRSLAA